MELAQEKICIAASDRARRAGLPKHSDTQMMASLIPVPDMELQGLSFALIVSV